MQSVKIFSLFIVILASLILSLPTYSGTQKSVKKVGGTSMPMEDPVVKKDLRIVVQVNIDKWEKGQGKALRTINGVLKMYDEMGVTKKDRKVHAVVHGSAAYWMLTDAAYNKWKKTDKGNPNAKLISELGLQGVHVEICNDTMKKKGWVDADLLPGVVPVVTAPHRIIDLQHRGYAYLRY